MSLQKDIAASCWEGCIMAKQKKRRPHRSYTDEEQAHACAAVAANGGNVNATARQLDIPAKSIENWIKQQRSPHVANLGELKKPALIDKLKAIAMKLVGIADKKASGLNAKDAMIAAGVWLRTPQNELVLLDALRFQADIPDIIPRLEALSRKWACSGDWIESVAANNGVYQLAKRTSEPARMLNPLGQDKLVRATAAMNLASEGRIWLPPPGLRPGMPLEDLEAEWYRFTGTKDDANDDAVDMLSYGARVLTSGPTAVGRNAVPMILGGNM